MPVADRGRMGGTGELVDLFGCRFDGFIGQQLIEVHGHPVSVPLRGGGKPDGHSVGDRTEDKGLAITFGQRPFLAAEESAFNIFPHLAQKRNLG